MRKTFWRPFLFLIAVLMLAACAQTEERPREIPPRPARDTIERFSLNARAVITYAGKANTLRILWDHSPEADNIGFATQLQGMVAELRRDNIGARWTTYAGDHYDARTPDVLIARMTKEPVPVAALTRWVTGRVTEDASDIQRDDKGRLLIAVDKGWVVQVISYETDLPNALPAVMEIRSPTVQIRLAFEDYAV